MVAKGLKWSDVCYLALPLGFEEKAVKLSLFKKKKC